MQRIIDILAVRRVDAADKQITQVLPVSPIRMGIAFRRDDPVLALRRQTIQDRLAKGPVRYVELEQQALLLSLLALDLAECADEVALRVPRHAVPAVDRDEDLLAK